MSQDPGLKYLNTGMNFVSSHHDTYPAIDPTRADLSGKHVLITGASKGVGKAIAISYAKAGASGIAIGARSPLNSIVEEIQAAAKDTGRAEPKIVALKLDVTDRKNVEAAARQVSEAFGGRLDILINNAGYLSAFLPLPETNPDDWWRDWEVSVKGTYLVTHSFWSLLLASSHKVIINLTSIGAHHISPGASAYQSAKLAVLRFTEFINQDHGAGKEGMLAISVHPGGVKTDLAAGMPDLYQQFLIDEPRLAGDAMVWLGKERREWLGGRYVSANWDVDELEQRKTEVLKDDLLKVRMAVNPFP